MNLGLLQLNTRLHFRIGAKLELFLLRKRSSTLSTVTWCTLLQSPFFTTSLDLLLVWLWLTQWGQRACRRPGHLQVPRTHDERALSRPRETQRFHEQAGEGKDEWV